MIDRDLSEHLGQHVYDEFCGTYGTICLGTDKYRLAYAEEAAELGFDEDGLLVRRERDGAFFGVQLSARMVQLPSAQERERAAADLPDECCWALWSPCGCACGVATGRSRGMVYAVTHGEAWRLLYEDWGRVEADQADGYQVELMTFDRYRADVAPKLLAKCPHRPEPAGQMELPGVTQ